MGDKRELVFTAVFLVLSIVFSPIIIDSIPMLASMERPVKILIAFAIPCILFCSFVFGLAFIMWILRKTCVRKSPPKQ